jgi:putative DNA primase/helicase
MTGNLVNIFGTSFHAYEEPPEVQLADAMAKAGLNPPEQVLLDGKMHRFNSDKRRDKSGWYVAYSDGVPAGRFGCWRQGIDQQWRANIGRQLTLAEEMANAKRMAEAKRVRDEDLAKQRAVVADTVETIWAGCEGANPDHAYLTRKGIGVHGARVSGDGRLVVPLYDESGNLSSLQYIDRDGHKLYHSGGRTGGCFWMVGTLDEPGILYVAEGFATAATIHEVTGRPCAVAYSASNLVPVVGTLRERYGITQDMMVIADNDASGTGQKYADQACAKHGVRSVTIPIPGDANDYVQAGNDLISLLHPKMHEWLDPVSSFLDQPAPPRWLIKGWLEQDVLCMVHGPSGAGKSFVVLDWCLHIASGQPVWNGSKINAGNVVYLAGEGHYGIRRRIAAWLQHNNTTEASMWLSRTGCDINTAEGYHKVVESIRALAVIPSVIVVDTVHRFMNGDENSAQDVKTMIDACNGLMREFGCTVVLVHHTGVSEEAQHRARGSSSWRGALESEYSVVPSKGEDRVIKLVNRKMKDGPDGAEAFFELTTVPINGWVDEDGEQVSSAILVKTEPPKEKPKKDSKLDDFRKKWERAWFDTGAETRDELPYVSRSGLQSWLIKQGIAERTVRNMLNPSYDDKMIGTLLQSETIEKFEFGWVMSNKVHAEALLMCRKSDPE